MSRVIYDEGTTWDNLDERMEIRFGGERVAAGNVYSFEVDE